MTTLSLMGGGETAMELPARQLATLANRAKAKRAMVSGRWWSCISGKTLALQGPDREAKEADSIS